MWGTSARPSCLLLAAVFLPLCSPCLANGMWCDPAVTSEVTLTAVAGDEQSSTALVSASVVCFGSYPDTISGISSDVPWLEVPSEVPNQSEFEIWANLAGLTTGTHAGHISVPGLNRDPAICRVTLQIAAFPDTPAGSWAWQEIAACSDQNIVFGYPDGLYHPEIEVTRDQMAVYIARALVRPSGDAGIPDPVPPPAFPDVLPDFWAYKQIEYAVSQNVVEGYPDGTYQPSLVVDRGQMAVYIARAMVAPTGDAAIADPEPPYTFADVPGDDNAWSWCHKHVEFLAGQGVVSGYPDGLYHPEDAVTRDQMAVYVHRALPAQFREEGVWHFDEGSGTRAYDSSGNGHTGTLYGGVGWSTDCAAGLSAIELDGATGYVEVSDVRVPGPILVEAWVKPARLAGSQRIVSKWWAGYGGNYELGLTDNHPYFQVGVDGSGYGTVADSFSLIADEWYHLVGVYSDGSVRVYVGTLSAAPRLVGRYDAVPAGELDEGITDVAIGNTGGGSAGFFQGIIDEVRIASQAY